LVTFIVLGIMEATPTIGQVLHDFWSFFFSLIIYLILMYGLVTPGVIADCVES